MVECQNPTVLFYRYQLNKAREDEIRAYNLKMKPTWDAEKVAKDAVANREQLLYLAKETGVKVSVVCCCKLNNTQVSDEHLFRQVSSCTGRYQLLIFRCTNVHL